VTDVVGKLNTLKQEISTNTAYKGWGVEDMKK